MEENREEESRLIDIPQVFFSDLTGKPIETCVSCDKDLLNSGEPYVIEKAFRYYPEYDLHNTIFEYAMCMPCAQKMHEAMSKESLQRIQEYFSKVNMMERSQKLWDKHGANIDAWIGHCVIKESSRGSLEEYQVCGQFIGNKLVFDALPYMLGIDAANEISELLSAKTLDEYDRFVDDHFGLPPEFKKALKNSPSVLA